MEHQIDGGAGESAAEDNVAQAARRFFGIPYLFPWQRLAIASILDGAEQALEQDSETDRAAPCGRIVILPTGAGKSLCFQIPALLLDGPTLVIYPLLALLADQKRRLDERGLQCVVLQGGQSHEEREECFRMILEGARFILSTPETLAAGNLAGRLSECSVAHIAIDEAHCVFEWGSTFRPAYLELGGIIRTIGAPSVTAFTATASPEVLANISDILFGGNAQVIRSESDRPNIRFTVKRTAAKQQAVLLLARTEMRPMLVFCGTRACAESMARSLNFCFGGGTARFYHAGLEREEKKEVEEWFYGHRDAILCATCAYGMGVDKRDIRTVVHLAPPDTAEAYIQEAGRGGRDGGTADAILLWSYADSAKFRKFPPGSRKSAIRMFAEARTCRRQILLDALGAEQAACSGCDICGIEGGGMNADSLRNERGTQTHVPGDAVPNSAEEALSLIRRRPRHYTEETLEDALLAILNRRAQKKIGLAVWDHAAFTEIIGDLISARKIAICAFPWRGRLRPNSGIRRSGILILVVLRFVLCGRRLGRGFRRSLRRLGGPLFRLRRALLIVRDKAAEVYVKKDNCHRSNHNLICQNLLQDRRYFRKIHIPQFSARFKIRKTFPFVYIGKNSLKNHLQENGRFNIF